MSETDRDTDPDEFAQALNTGQYQAITGPRMESHAAASARARAAAAECGAMRFAVRAAYPRRRGQRVLVVDDDREVAFAVAIFLQRAGYDTDEAADAATAMLKANLARQLGGYDAAIVDQRLPGAPGEELIRQLRVPPLRDRMPIVLISGIDLEELESARDRCGADACLRKPIDADELVRTLERLLPAFAAAI